jgi:hypothetical protein
MAELVCLITNSQGWRHFVVLTETQIQLEQAVAVEASTVCFLDNATMKQAYAV